ncbi:MAG: rhomboid family intramembrane serine protease [Planctomycetota bacterium]
MGLEDRQYYRDDEQYSYTGNFGGGGYQSAASGPATWTIITWIIIVNVAIFLIDTFTDFSKERGLGQLMLLLALDTDQPWKIWTFLTHGFAHSSMESDTSFWHLFGNMITLFFLGRPVEQRLGRNEFLRFYTVSILVAAVVMYVSVLVTGGRSVMVGASGAVSAVVMLFIFMYPKVKVLLMGIIPMPAWLLGVLVVGVDISRAFSPENHIAWQAHLGGAAFGALYLRMNWNLRWLGSWLGGEAGAGGGIGSIFKSRPNLKIHKPEARLEKLKSEADAVLEKINTQGEESLSRRERKILNQYSELIRKSRED